ncbi:MAG: hypothetical protein FJ010_09425 [Chloroflexi bacterium]|nr:hypothetical protein [Chloroflexota bacterium]
MNYARHILRISQPLLLLDAALVYTLGVGIAHYLGATIDMGIFALGLAWVISLQLGAHFLYAYFAHGHSSPVRQDDPLMTGPEINPRLAREIPLWVGLTALTLTTSFTLLLMRSSGASVGVYIVMVLIALGAFVSALPPLRLADTIYRGLIPSVVLANFVPALAYILQAQDIHRLLSMSTFPLTLLHYAMLFVFEFRHYARDLRREHPTLLIRLGWRRGMRLIDLLVLSTFLLFGVAMLAGLPDDIAWPTFLALPLGLFLIWYLSRIAAGAKPHWTALDLAAILTYSLAVYLLTFSFWTH